VTVPGGSLVEVGDHIGTGAEQIEEAIGDATAAIHYLAPGEGDGVVSLEAVIDIGKRHGIPIIVDAAGQVYPVEKMKKYMAMGADLVGFGAKYFGAPNSSGILCGRRDLVEAASLHGFIGFEASPHRAFGRPMKLDRQEIVAVVVALQEWLTMDHGARFASYEKRAARLDSALEGVPNLEIMPDGCPVTGLRVVVGEKAAGKTAAEVAAELQAGNPSIWVDLEGDAITIWVSTLADGDELVVADSLKHVLAGLSH
jgi:L-seryl-tRNA(Ser) seleniumtransferase